VESAVAWQAAIERRDGPSALLFTRQNVAFQKRDDAQVAAIRRGGYVLADFGDANAARRAAIIATGSEVAVAMAARETLAGEGIAVRVVSMPCTRLFDSQDAAYRTSVLPPGVPRVAVEAGSTEGWHKYVGAIDDRRGAVVGLDRFGESAPGPVLFKFFGFTPDNVAAAVRRVLA
jgi:transketolase